MRRNKNTALDIVDSIDDEFVAVQARKKERKWRTTKM